MIEVNIGEMLEKRARRNISQTSRIEISTTAFYMHETVDIC